MGYSNQGFALVSMTNKDVYNVSIEDGKQILKRLARQFRTAESGFFETVDVKSGATVSIAIQHVSSVIVKEAGRHV